MGESGRREGDISVGDIVGMRPGTLHMFAKRTSDLRRDHPPPPSSRCSLRSVSS